MEIQKLCPKCYYTHLKVNTSLVYTVYTSDPPQYKAVCSTCGYREYIFVHLCVPLNKNEKRTSRIEDLEL